MAGIAARVEMTRLISIIVPVYNEAGNIQPLFARLRPVISSIRTEFGFQVEVVVNDNCSTDDTFLQLAEVCHTHDPAEFEIRVHRFSRNIGFQRSILVGYRKALGDAAIQIDADLQDPPELIPTFIREWLAGHRVVYGVRRQRRENPVMSIVRKLFYRILKNVSEDDLPVDSGDFRLVDRVIIDVVCSVQDQDPYLRGLIASLGCRQKGVVYDRDARSVGESKFTLVDLAKLAFDGFTNHSIALLRLSSYCAVLVGLTMIGIICFYLFSWIVLKEELPVGFMTQTLLELGGIAAISLLFSIHGAYLSRIYRQVKPRPLAIIEEEMVIGKVREDFRPEVLWVGEKDE